MFVLPEPPPENSKEKLILDKITADNNYLWFAVNDAAYSPSDNSVITSKRFLSDMSKPEIKALFAHEIGHAVDYKTRGMPRVEYDESRTINPELMDKFSTNCKTILVDKKIPEDLAPLYHKATNGKNFNIGSECSETITEIEKKRSNAIRDAQNETNRLTREQEKRADAYAALAAHGAGLISLKQNSTSGDVYNNTHSSSNERIRAVAEIMKNPDAAKAKFEQDLANFRRNVYQPTEASHGDKSPPPVSAPAPAQPTGTISR